MDPGTEIVPELDGPEPGDPIWSVAEAIADGQAPDWGACGPDSPDPEPILAELRHIQALVGHHRAARAHAASLPGARDEAPGGGGGGWSWGHLRVLEPLGKGEFGEVFKAYDLKLQREVALKLRWPRRTNPAADADRYLSEARRLARVHHPNVISVHGADVHDGRIGLWTDLLIGTTLEEHLQLVGLFGTSEATLIGLDMCRALAAVHAAGVLHRDVKTTNVMREKGGRVVLLDLGAGTDVPGPGSLVDVGAVYGTLATSAPELLRGKPAGPSVDLYALGVLLYRLVTGRYPIEAASFEDLLAKHSRGEIHPLRDLRPDIAPEFVAVVERAVSPRPEERFQSAGEMERALRGCLGVAGSDALSTRSRFPALALVGVALACVTLGTLMGRFVGVEDPSRWINRSEGPPGVGVVFVNETALCTAPRTQWLPTLASDGRSGALVVWQDERNGAPDIYAQHFGHLAVPLWAPDGVPVCTADGDQRLNGRVAAGRQQVTAVISDGAGGAIVAWSDLRGRDSDIYAQRLTAAGELAPGWRKNGVPLCVAPGDQMDPTIAPDGAGGAIVTWRDARDPTGTMMDIYAQRVTAGGTIATTWPRDGATICNVHSDQQLPTIAADGVGGAYICWYDYRGDSSADIYMQRVDASGKRLWPSEGIGVARTPGLQLDPVAIGDGARGVLVVWRDARASANATDIYAQRLGPDGRPAPGWPEGGLPLCAEPRDQVLPVLSSDGAGGAIVAWVDYRDDSQGDIYAQRVGAEGRILWSSHGVPVRVGPGPQREPTICSDSKGGAVVSFGGRSPEGPDGIYAQRLGPDGKLLWSLPSVVICRAAGSQTNPFAVPGRGNGAIVAWVDGRAGNYKDVFAALVGSTPSTPTPDRRQDAGSAE